MPRSGTTLVEQIISCHSKVQGAGELPFLHRFFAPFSFGKQKLHLNGIIQARKNYLTEIEKISCGKPFVTDKLPQNFRFIGFIVEALPEAKIIHVKRDPAATCWSNFKHIFPANGLGYSCTLDDTIHYFKMYQDLISFWEHKYGDKIYHLDYEELTHGQEIETRKLIEHLGLDWENDCLSPQDNKRNVSTASKHQVRERIYKGSSQAWQKFKPYINGAFDELHRD